jgi:cold shock CspA family protein
VPAGDRPGLATGRVDVVRPDKGFGFLVDERDGKRRHFRIKSAQSFRRGDRVRFEPYEAEKGPAARVLARV